jgi:hypothetical protein
MPLSSVNAHTTPARRRPFKEPQANLGSKRQSLPDGGADPDDVEAPAILT